MEGEKTRSCGMTEHIRCENRGRNSGGRERLKTDGGTKSWG